jgi:hypothetical protein
MVILEPGTQAAAAIWSESFGGNMFLLIVSGVVRDSSPKELNLVDETGGVHSIKSHLGKMTSVTERDGRRSSVARVYKTSPLTEKFTLDDFVETVKAEAGISYLR